MILIASAIGMAAFIKQAGTIAAEFAGFTGSMGNVGGAGGAAVGGAVVAGGGAIGLVGGRMGMKAGQAVGGKLKSMGGSNSGSGRSEEHTSELQSLMRISYAVFCLKKKTTDTKTTVISYNEASRKKQ